jgi:hypothetical protein
MLLVVLQTLPLTHLLPVQHACDANPQPLPLLTSVHVPALQLPEQQLAPLVQAAPAAPQVPAAHVPPAHRPEQHSPLPVQLMPTASHAQ